MSRFKIDQAGLTESLGGACRTPRLDDRDMKNPRDRGRGQIGPCPSCDVPVINERIGGSLRRFCSSSCRWSWHRGERRRRLIEAIEAAACSRCCKLVLEAIGLLTDRDMNGGDAL